MKSDLKTLDWLYNARRPRKEDTRKNEEGAEKSFGKQQEQERIEILDHREDGSPQHRSKEKKSVLDGKCTQISSKKIDEIRHCQKYK